ncbi:MAG: hypothetical protein J1E06_07055 [Acutalibacter sp.]|nr:hypothetical protein [Acutalibacter sp.]
MADYQKMYSLLCRAASKAIDAPPEEARQLLQKALFEAENIYIHTCEGDYAQPKLRLLI